MRNKVGRDKLFVAEREERRGSGKQGEEGWPIKSSGLNRSREYNAFIIVGLIVIA